MKNKFKFNLALSILAIALLSILSSCKKETNAKTDIETDLYASVDETTCNCGTDWFPHSQTPAPEEGKGSPFDVKSTNDSIFHQWSWQKFLWLTKPMGNSTLFEQELTLVTNQLEPVAPVDNIKLVLSDIGQAGSDGILLSNVNFNKERDTVYYGIYANDILLLNSEIAKAAILRDTTRLDNSEAFPVGSLEVKTSWVKASSIPTAELATYYTTEAYIKSEGLVTPVALLGMHVVGVVENHPEFIWATFEHNDMAAFYDWAATTDSDIPVTSNQELLFFTKGAEATIADITYPSSGPPPAIENVFTVFQYGIPRTAGNKFMPNTSQNDASTSSNLNNIEALNKCVSDNLQDVFKYYFYNGSVWANTDGLSSEEQIAMLKNAGGSIGSAKTGSHARGALGAFNITMETFAQTFMNSEIHNMNSSDVINCMFCHTASASIKINGVKHKGKSSALYFSHIFRSYLSVDPETSINEIEQLRLEEFMELVNAKTKNK